MRKLVNILIVFFSISFLKSSSYSYDFLNEKNKIAEGIEHCRQLIYSGMGTITYEYNLIKDSSNKIPQTPSTMGLETVKVHHFKKKIKCYFEKNKYCYESKFIEGDSFEIKSIFVKNNGEQRKISFMSDMNNLCYFAFVFTDWDSYKNRRNHGVGEPTP